jgi:hypothetical protein
MIAPWNEKDGRFFDGSAVLKAVFANAIESDYANV